MKTKPNHLPASDDPDERATLPVCLAWALAIAGLDRFTLDAFASKAVHVAERYYTKRDNGLARPWFGDTWGNIPFSLFGAALEKAAHESRRSKVSSICLLVPGDRDEQPAWQRHIEHTRDGRDLSERLQLSTHTAPGRWQFGTFDLPDVPMGSPNFVTKLLVWSSRPIADRVAAARAFVDPDGGRAVRLSSVSLFSARARATTFLSLSQSNPLHPR